MNEPTPETTYDRALRQARQLEVREDHTRQAVAEILRAARLSDIAARAPGRNWRWLVAPALAAAIAVAVVVVTFHASSPRLDGTSMTGIAGQASGVVQVGPRVALVPAPGASYALRTSDRHATRLEVLTGAVTVRLLAGSEPHQLLVAAGGWIAEAKGPSTPSGMRPAGRRTPWCMRGRSRCIRHRATTP